MLFLDIHIARTRLTNNWQHDEDFVRSTFAVIRIHLMVLYLSVDIFVIHYSLIYLISMNWYCFRCVFFIFADSFCYRCMYIDIHWYALTSIDSITQFQQVWVRSSTNSCRYLYMLSGIYLYWFKMLMYRDSSLIQYSKIVVDVQALFIFEDIC